MGRAVEETICDAADIVPVRPSIAPAGRWRRGALGDAARTKLGTMAGAPARAGPNSFNVKVFKVFLVVRTSSMSNVHVVAHPLVQHKLTLMRDKTVSTKGFRQLMNEIGMLLAYEVTRDLPLEVVEVETPLTKTMAPTISGKKLVFAPILRAGVGFLDGMLDLVPSARVAHIGLYRDPHTLEAVEYYFKAPADVADRLVIVMDPMLATANSAVAAIDRLKRRGVRDIRFVCLLAAPEGIERLTKAHPEVQIWTAAVDERLDDHGYIVPGLGDAGDRMFGTK